MDEGVSTGWERPVGVCRCRAQSQEHRAAKKEEGPQQRGCRGKARERERAKRAGRVHHQRTAPER